MLRGLQLLPPNQRFEERKEKMAHSGSYILDDKKVQDVEAPEDGLRGLDVDLEVGGDDILRQEHTDPVLNAKVRTSKKFRIEHTSLFHEPQLTLVYTDASRQQRHWCVPVPSPIYQHRTALHPH